jgi:hypothetical protein
MGRIRDKFRTLNYTNNINSMFINNSEFEQITAKIITVSKCRSTSQFYRLRSEYRGKAMLFLCHLFQRLRNSQSARRSRWWRQCNPHSGLMWAK